MRVAKNESVKIKLYLIVRLRDKKNLVITCDIPYSEALPWASAVTTTEPAPKLLMLWSKGPVILNHTETQVPADFCCYFSNCQRKIKYVQL